MKELHYNEWIKKYSPENQIISKKELALMIGISLESLHYYTEIKGFKLLDKSEPAIAFSEEVVV